MTAVDLTDRQRLLDLFSAVANSNVELVVYERDEPDAPDALRAWASSVERRVNAQDLDGLGTVWFIEGGRSRRGIQVYSLPRAS